jgi:hypothetical protein
MNHAYTDEQIDNYVGLIDDCSTTTAKRKLNGGITNLNNTFSTIYFPHNRGLQTQE